MNDTSIKHGNSRREFSSQPRFLTIASFLQKSPRLLKSNYRNPPNFVVVIVVAFFCRIKSIVSRPFAVRIDLFSNFCSGQREYPNNTDSGHWTVSQVRGTQISYNPLHLNISKRFLQTVLYKFPKMLSSRICVTVKSFFGR